jgi:hypothetical protein
MDTITTHIEDGLEDPKVAWLDFLDSLPFADKVCHPDYIFTVICDGDLDGGTPSIVPRAVLEADTPQVLELLNKQGLSTIDRQGPAIAKGIAQMLDAGGPVGCERAVRLAYAYLTLDPGVRMELPMEDVRIVVIARLGSSLTLACSDTKEDFAAAMVNLEEQPQGGNQQQVH